VISVAAYMDQQRPFAEPYFRAQAERHVRSAWILFSFRPDDGRQVSSRARPVADSKVQPPQTPTKWLSTL
jgi:hypothetical protein